MRLPGYVEFVHDDMRFHIWHRGEEVGGAFGMIYCPICGGLAGECNCQPSNIDKLKQEVEEAKRKEKGCEYCRGEKPLVPSTKEMYSGATGEITIRGDSLILKMQPQKDVKEATTLARFINYCPNCGQALESSSRRERGRILE